MKTSIIALATLSLLACTAGKPTAPADSGQAPTPGNTDLAASAATTAETGIVRWTGQVGPGATINVDGRTASGFVRLHLAGAATDPTAQTGSVGIAIYQDDGIATSGRLSLKDGAVVSNTLAHATGAATYFGHLRDDLNTAPRALDYAACAVAQTGYFQAVLAEELACFSGNALACGVAILYATNEAEAMNLVCDGCPCEAGYTCTQGECTEVDECIFYGSCGYDDCGQFHPCPNGEDCDGNSCEEPCDLAACYADCDNEDRGCDESTCGCYVSN